jgi:hypothetical protein
LLGSLERSRAQRNFRRKPDEPCRMHDSAKMFAELVSQAE